jgi:hypothetical protein
VHPVKEQEWAAEGAITILPKQKTVKGKQTEQGKQMENSCQHFANRVHTAQTPRCWEAEFSVSLCTVFILNLRFYHLRLTLGCSPLCIHIIGTREEPPTSAFEQYESWKEPQLNLR